MSVFRTPETLAHENQYIRPQSYDPNIACGSTYLFTILHITQVLDLSHLGFLSITFPQTSCDEPITR